MDRRIKNINWTTRATSDLKKVSKFYVNLYGSEKAREILTEIRQSTEILKHNNIDTSKIGAIDEALAHLKRNYRKLIVHHCKVTYREGRTKIYIVRVFDTRQHPTKNK